MKTLFWSLGAVGLAGLIAGCEPELAQQPAGAEEAQWQSVIKESYPGWRPPRVAPPAIKDSFDKSVYEEDARKKAEAEAKAEAEKAASELPAAETEKLPPAAAEDAAAGEVKKADAEKADAAPEKLKAGEDKKADPGAAVKSGEKEPVTYTVVAGDTLSSIAKKFYKDGNKYPRIIKANEETLRGNPNRIRAGMRLFIPQE